MGTGTGGPDGRVLLFAHNGHVQKSTPLVSEMPYKPYPPMGAHLHFILGDAMIVLGWTFREAHGDFGLLGKFSSVDPRSLDGILSQLRLPAFALDLRTRPQPSAVQKLLNSPIRMRSNDQYAESKPVEALDLLLFVDRVSLCTP
jgi:hypothetical protein